MRPFIIMILVLVEVALWQWRVAVTGRGHYLRGAALGGLGAVIQITVVIRLVGEVGGAASIAGYAAGVALGVAAGGVLDRRATPQMLKVQVIAPSRHELPRHVRSAGWPLTQFNARGDEDVDVIGLQVPSVPRGAAVETLTEPGDAFCRPLGAHTSTRRSSSTWSSADVRSRRWSAADE